MNMPLMNGWCSEASTMRKDSAEHNLIALLWAVAVVIVLAI